MVCNCELHHWWGILWPKRSDTIRKKKKKFSTFPPWSSSFGFSCLFHFTEPLHASPTPLFWFGYFFSPIFSPPNRRITKQWFTTFYALIHSKSKERSKCLTHWVLTKCFPFLYAWVCKAGRNANESKLHHLLLPEKGQEEQRRLQDKNTTHSLFTCLAIDYQPISASARMPL